MMQIMQRVVGVPHRSQYESGCKYFWATNDLIKHQLIKFSSNIAFLLLCSRSFWKVLTSKDF